MVFNTTEFSGVIYHQTKMKQNFIKTFMEMIFFFFTKRKKVPSKFQNFGLILEFGKQTFKHLLSFQILLQIDEESDIAYTVTAPAAGGLIAMRDFVNLRHWKTCGDTILSAGRTVLHPSKPHQHNIVR